MLRTLDLFSQTSERFASRASLSIRLCACCIQAGGLAAKRRGTTDKDDELIALSIFILSALAKFRGCVCEACGVTCGDSRSSAITLYAP